MLKRHESRLNLVDLGHYQGYSQANGITSAFRWASYPAFPCTKQFYVLCADRHGVGIFVRKSLMGLGQKRRAQKQAPRSANRRPKTEDERPKIWRRKC